MIVGLPTSIPLLQAIADDPVFAEGDYHIGWLPEFLEAWQAAAAEPAPPLSAATGDRYARAMLALTPDLLLCAYASGLFPMANDRHDPTIHWIEPRRRGILPLERFHSRGACAS